MDKERPRVVTKGSIFQGDITITTINTYVPKNRAAIYMRQKLTKLKVEMGKFIILRGIVTCFPQ